VDTDVLIVGGGLSGLRAAHLLSQENLNITVLESRTRFGGRILSSIEFRLAGGMMTLITRLSSALARKERNVLLKVNSQVLQLTKTDEGVSIVVKTDSGRTTLEAKQVIIAAPPRIVQHHIQFFPVLPAKQQDLLLATPTWMAGQAKFVAVYHTPFWRNNGLSGDAVSEIGPMGEMHDASSKEEGTHALFGFLGIPHASREQRKASIRRLCSEQFSRIFGTGSEQPVASFFKDWAGDDFTSTELDLSGRAGHAQEVIDTDPYWDNRLFWAGSETASVANGENGYLEGALASAERAAEQVLRLSKN